MFFQNKKRDISYFSIRYKNFTFMLVLLFSLFVFIMSVFLSSKLWLPDDRQKRTMNLSMYQTVGNSRFNFDKFSVKNNQIDILVKQDKIDSVGTDEKLKEQYKMYMLVDKKKFTDFNVISFDNTYTYQYFLKAPIPEKFYYLTVIIEKIDKEGKGSGDGVFVELDYRDMKENESVLNIENAMENYRFTKTTLQQLKLEYESASDERKKALKGNIDIYDKKMKQEFEKMKKIINNDK